MGNYCKIIEEAIGNKWWPGSLKPILEYDEQDSTSAKYITKLPKREWNQIDKDAVLGYLRLPIHYATATLAIEKNIDAFTNNRIVFDYDDPSKTVNHDGVWIWKRTLSYYIDKYDVDIDEQFIEHAYKQLGLNRADYN